MLRNKKSLLIISLALLFALVILVNKYRGFEFLHRIISDAYAIYQLPKIPNYDDQIIELPFYVNKLNDEEILDIISKNDSLLFSQRLIMGLNNYHSIDYILFRLFNKPMTINLNSKGVMLLEGFSNKVKYGIGGVSISYTALASIDSVSQFNSLISQLDSLLAIKRKYNFIDNQITLDILPSYYCDYNFFNKGLNAKIINSLKNRYRTNLDSNIYFMKLDGLFGPNLDYSDNIKKEKVFMLEKSNNLEHKNFQLFAKHFGYRSDYRYSIDYIYPDPHHTSVYLKTPLSIFMNEDLKLLDSFIHQTKQSGIMIGHHILEALDNEVIASASEKIQTFIENRYKRKLLTISDSINMYAFQIHYNKNISLYDYVKTDLILLTNIYGYDLLSFTKNGIKEKSGTYKKILKHKFLNGKISIKRMDS